jgi:hypothetical protein
LENADMLRFDRALRAIAQDTSAAIAAMAGIMFVPLILFFGLAFDYTNAARIETNLQSSLDAGLLSVANRGDEFSEDPTTRKEEIDARLHAFLMAAGLQDDVADAIRVESTVTSEGISASASTNVPTYLMRVVGFETLQVRVDASVVAASDAPVEIAMALDVTDSMAGDMDKLRAGAQGFIDQVTGGSTNPNVKIGIVPFVGGVNIGNPQGRAGWMDNNANSKYHAMNLEGAWVAMKKISGCTEQGGDDGGIGGGSDTDTRGWIDLSAINGMVASAVRELFGIAPAAAYELEQVPASWSAESHCYWMNPAKINHATLFNLTPGAVWKGCVEARPEPHDITDTAPKAGSPNTLFVPYFWPDATDNNVPGYAKEYHNNYMVDGPYPPNTNMATHGWGRFYSIAKYRAGNATSIVETAPDVKGPNRACPESLLPLTTDYSAISSKIASLKHYAGAGTITSEGLAWAWRVLSPGVPFTEGVAYGEKRKVLVLISDGANRLNRDAREPDLPPGQSRFTNYSAYGSLKYGRLAEVLNDDTDVDKVNTYFDQRMSQVCTNIKATGIEIFVIAFGIEEGYARQLLQNCATTSDNFIVASRSEQLNIPFQHIASKLSTLRLTR